MKNQAKLLNNLLFSDAQDIKGSAGGEQTPEKLHRHRSSQHHGQIP